MMVGADVVPEGATSSQRLSDTKYVQENVTQCFRYIKLLGCAFSILAALCISTIAVLSWHIMRSGDNFIAVEEEIEIKAKENASTFTIMMMEKEVRASKAVIGGVRLELENLKTHQAEKDKTTMQLLTGFGDILARVKATVDKVAGLTRKQEFEGGQQPETTYVRWGHTECPTNETKLVYSGYMGGTYFSEASGPQNSMCLPIDPDWEHYESSVQNGSKVYGAEYRFGGHTDYAQSFFKKTTRGYEVPCAVCLAPSTTVLMIPAKRNCSEGWKKEYEGYLAAGWNLSPSNVNYFCLDKDPQLLNGSSELHKGIPIHLVESICDSLPCPPYYNGRELTCVVCSK